MGFEPQVNQRLLPPTFPRYTHLRSRMEAMNYFLQLMERIKRICKIKDCTNFHVALVNPYLYNFFTIFICRRYEGVEALIP